jgi:YD repeat-containing protein
MQGLTQDGSIERQIAGPRVDGQGGVRPDPGDRLLHVVHPGLHITRITRIAQGQMQGKDEASCRLGDHARLAAKLGGAVAFALAHGRYGGIVGVDDLAMGQGLALCQSS